jgi:hypothetical protein
MKTIAEAMNGFIYDRRQLAQDHSTTTNAFLLELKN